MNNYQVSVLVAIYNPTWSRLERSLRSVLLQREIKVQIVVCDDGSQVNYENDVSEFLKKEKYADYKYIRSEKNLGTVGNLLHGLSACKGEYIKVLGQGDVLHDEDTLMQMYNFAKEHKLKALAGLFQCYKYEENKVSIISIRRMPQDLESFSNSKKAKKRYVVCWDILNAATLLYEKNTLQIYLEEIVGKIKLCEDHALRLMIMDEVSIDIIKIPVIYYESGVGVSNGGNTVYREILNQDRITFFKMAQRRDLNNKHFFNIFEKRINAIKSNNKLATAQCLFSDKDIFMYWLQSKYRPIMTSIEMKNSFLNQCIEGEVKV